MTFATVSKGYKGPAFASVASLGVPVAVQVDPETSRNFEIGMRAQLLDRKLTANITAFLTKFTDFQAQTFDPDALQQVLRNAGKVSTRGIELELSAKPVQGLVLTADAAYSDAKYDEFEGLSCSAQFIRFNPGRCYTPAGAAASVLLYDANDFPVANAPKFTYSLSGAYEAPVGVAHKARMDVIWTHRSKFYFQPGDRATVEPGYGLLNANLAFGSEDEQWTVSVYARNILDKHFRSSMQGTIISGATYVQSIPYQANRTFGAALEVKF